MKSTTAALLGIVIAVASIPINSLIGAWVIATIWGWLCGAADFHPPLKFWYGVSVLLALLIKAPERKLKKNDESDSLWETISPVVVYPVGLLTVLVITWLTRLALGW